MLSHRIGGRGDRLELLEPGELGDVDLAGELAADRVVECEAPLEVAAGQRPGPGEGLAAALPKEHAERLVPHLQDHGERDMCGGGALHRYTQRGRFSIIRQKPRHEAHRAPDTRPQRRSAAQRRRPDANAGRGACARGGAQRGDPRAQLSGARGAGRGPLRGGLARPLSQGGRDRRGRHRLLRRPLHGRDGFDPVARQDGPAARPRRRLLARGLDQRTAAARLEGKAPGRHRRHVREHDRGGEGGDRLLLHVGERGRRGAPHLRRARRRHRDPLRPGHVARRLRREDDRAAHARVGRRVPRARRHPPRRHRRRAGRAPGAPSS